MVYQTGNGWCGMLALLGLRKFTEVVLKFSLRLIKRIKMKRKMFMHVM